jgi:hypothetical protein
VIRTCVFVLVLSITSRAHADQVQADLGLTVVDIAYEHDLTSHVSIAGGAGIFGTYFLPWFDLGDDVKGLDAEVRGTWFAKEEQRGLYVTPYVRAAVVRGENDAEGWAMTAGAFVGYAFQLTTKLDLRLGLGAQYIYVDADPASASTPFLAIDGLLGYRL